MRAVLDASVALKAVLAETDSDKALRLLEEYRLGLHQFLAPDVFLAEVGHALTRAERKKIIPLGDAVIHFDSLITPPPDLHDSAPLMIRAVELSSQTRASVYDCLYLLLAEEQGCDFVTADAKLVKTFPGSPKVIDLSQL